MGDIVLTEHEQLCRTAHEQVAILQSLYDHLLLDESSETKILGFSARDRVRELKHASEMLSHKLEALDLLPAIPDPEREGVLAVFAKLKHAFDSESDSALAERLGEEEGELLRLSECLAQHDRDPALSESLERTRVVCQHLKSASADG